MAPRTVTVTHADDQTKFEEAYKRVEPELVAMSPEEIAPINLDGAKAMLIPSRRRYTRVDLRAKRSPQMSRMQRHWRRRR